MEPWRGAPDLSCERTQDELAAAGLIDGLPVVPPTAERAALSIDRLSAPMRKRVIASAAADGNRDVLRVANSPQDVMIVVAGGVGRKATYVPTWSGTTRAVSRGVCRT